MRGWRQDQGRSWGIPLSLCPAGQWPFSSVAAASIEQDFPPWPQWFQSLLGSTGSWALLIPLPPPCPSKCGWMCLSALADLCLLCWALRLSQRLCHESSLSVSSSNSPRPEPTCLGCLLSGGDMEGMSMYVWMPALIPNPRAAGRLRAGQRWRLRLGWGGG